MSKWDAFKKSACGIADKTLNVTRELTDTAALKIKIGNKEAERDTEYKNLGRLTYAKLKKLSGADSDAITAEISDTLDRLDAINRELSRLKAEEKARKDAKEAEKAEKAAQKKAAEEMRAAEVMEEFSEARKTADGEFDIARAAAEEAKAEAEAVKNDPLDT